MKLHNFFIVIFLTLSLNALAKDFPENFSMVYDLYQTSSKLGKVDVDYSQSKNNYKLNVLIKGQGILSLMGDRKLTSQGKINTQRFYPVKFEHRNSKRPKKNITSEFFYDKKLIKSTYKGRIIEKETRDELLLMHGIRVAIFHEIFLLSVRIPKFSDQAGTSRDEVIAKLIRFDIFDAVSILRKIFPTGKLKASNTGFSDKSDYVSEGNINYTKEEKAIFQQLEALYECARRVSNGITHFIGSVG